MESIDIKSMLEHTNYSVVDVKFPFIVVFSDRTVEYSDEWKLLKVNRMSFGMSNYMVFSSCSMIGPSISSYKLKAYLLNLKTVAQKSFYNLSDLTCWL